MSRPIDRRTLLRGAGAALALPFLDAMVPTFASVVSAAPVSKTPPLRLGFVYVPNGVHRPAWTPEDEGVGYAMPSTLAPLAPIRDRLLVLSGLAHAKAEANGDGPGDHARAGATFLTGAQARKAAGAQIRAGVSIDQLAAEAVGSETALPSLELGCEPGGVSGDCDSGYSCAYSSNLSWRTPTTPMGKEIDPRAVFERLFGDPTAGSDAERAVRRRRRASVLDAVREEAASLRARLGTSDRRKVDEYLDGVRSLERRIARVAAVDASDSARRPVNRAIAKRDAPGAPVEAGIALERPPGEPRDFADRMSTMGELVALAFQGDVTRVFTLLVANEGSNRSYPSIGVPEGHHGLSHHGDDAAAQAKIARVNLHHMELFATLAARLRRIPEGDGTLLDHVAIVYGSGIGDGNRHDHADLPILVVGGGAGTIATGRHVRHPARTPVSNLLLSLLDRLPRDRSSAPRPSFGDSTGRLAL